MSSTTRAATLLRACTLGLALAATPAALGQAATPVGATTQPADSQTTASQTTASQTTAGQTTDSQTAETQPAAESNDPDAAQALSQPAGPSATARTLAQWVRAIGGRICIGPKLVYGDRVSTPNSTDRLLDWRVSLPSFDLNRVSAPPARAHAAQPGSDPATTPATDEVATATEPAGN